MQTSLLDNGRNDTKEPYNNKYTSDDSYDIINVGTKSRITTISVNGIMNDDNVFRAALNTDDRDEFGSYIDGKDANGAPIIKKSINYAPRNNQSRWQFFNGTKTVTSNTNNNKTNPTKVEKPIATPTTVSTNNTNSNNANNANVNNNTNNAGLIGNWILKSLDRFSIVKGTERKIPNLLGNIGNKKLEFDFKANNKLYVYNTGTTEEYNWEVDKENNLKMTPIKKENNDDGFNQTYIGTMKIDGNKMIFTVVTSESKNRIVKEVFTYEKK
jgi:hypothetical protein